MGDDLVGQARRIIDAQWSNGMLLRIVLAPCEGTDRGADEFSWTAAPLLDTAAELQGAGPWRPSREVDR